MSKNKSKSKQKSEIQSIVFNSPPWDISQALTWLKTNKKEFVKVDIKPPNNEGVMQLRFRQTPPKRYKRFTTVKTKNDILLILGWK